MIGKIISHYEIVEKLGEGGMGVVYRAHDTILGRDVAVKFLPPQLNSDRQAQQRFIQEARAASALDHSNIAVIHEIGETPEGHMFIVMACYDGQTLKQKLADGPLSVDDALHIASKIASALGAAHEHGILHRDVKPANVLITERGEVKLTDFGLAKLRGQTRLTRTGATVGTVAYMSPEQANGQDVDARSDIFSLGVVLYEMLTGETPFQSDHEAAVLYGIINAKPAPLATRRPDLPVGIQDVMDKMLAKKPDDRYASAVDLMEALAALDQTRPAARNRQSRRLIRGVSYAATVAVLAAVAPVLLNWEDHVRAPEEASATSSNDVFTITVAPFWGINEKAMEEAEFMHGLIEAQLEEAFRADADIRVISAGTAVPPRLRADAWEFGQNAGATMVVWGEVLVLRDEIQIQPHITMVKPFDSPGQREETCYDRPIEQLVGTLQGYVSETNAIAERKAKAHEVRNMVLLVAGSYYSVQEECERQQDCDRAKSLLRRIAPVSADQLAWLGNAYYNSGQTAEAESLITASLELNPNNPFAYNVLGWIRAFQQQDDEGALEAYQQGISVDPSFSPSYGNAGISCARLGRYDEALHYYEEALRTGTPSALTNLNISLVYWEKREFDKMERALTTAVKLDSLWVPPCLGFLRLRYAQERYQEAMEWHDRAMRLAGDNGTIPGGSYYALLHTICLHRTGARNEAIAMATRAAAELSSDGWVAPVIRYYAGQIGAGDVLTAAASDDPKTDNDRKCEAYYYLGMASLLGVREGEPPDTALAIDYLDKCVATKRSGFIEYMFAGLELEQLAGWRHPAAGPL